MSAIKEIQTEFEELMQDKKCQYFKEELDEIQDVELKVFASKMISQLPNYFFLVPASSTGKYHPMYALGEGGLLRHTKAAVRVALELLRLNMYKPIFHLKDYIIVALILHDGWKHGQPDENGNPSQYTVSNHSEVCANWIRSYGSTLIDAGKANYIADLVLTHMGQWNMDYKTGRYFAPEPSTIEACFVHMCDYLASRKCLEMNFTIPFEGYNK